MQGAEDPGHRPRIIRSAVIVLSVVLGLALLLSLPLAIFALFMFVANVAFTALFFPGLALYLGFIGVAALLHGISKSRGRGSSRLVIGDTIYFHIAWICALIVGQLLLVRHVELLFWVPFIVAASAPALAPLAYASGRLGPATTWRRACFGLVTGSVVSTHLTILLAGTVGLLAYAIVAPIRTLIADLLASPSLERMFFSPGLVLASISAVIVAPLVEELTKPIGAAILGRRLRSRAEAFLVGMAGGAGFAIIENMLYEASGAWAGVAFTRGIGGVLHPLNAGLVALGWYAVRQGEERAWSRLLGYYGLAVAAHMAWNGGLTILYSAVGTYFFGADTWRLTIYGVGQPIVVLALLILESAALWRLLGLITSQLRGSQLDEVTMDLGFARPRRLAILATALFFGLGTLGALFGPLAQKYWQRLLPLT